MQTNPLEQLLQQQRKSGTNQQGLAAPIVFLVAAVVIGLPFFGGLGVVMVIMAVAVLAAAVQSQKKRQQDQRQAAMRRAQAQQQQAPRPAQPQTQRPAAAQNVRCDNPEPHRHYEPPKAPPKAACPNPEPHRHTEQAANFENYVRHCQEKRREGMHNLYEAGLLTREEYHDELRRLP